MITHLAKTWMASFPEVDTAFPADETDAILPQDPEISRTSMRACGEVVVNLKLRRNGLATMSTASVGYVEEGEIYGV